MPRSQKHGMLGSTEEEQVRLGEDFPGGWNEYWIPQDYRVRGRTGYWSGLSVLARSKSYAKAGGERGCLIGEQLLVYCGLSLELKREEQCEISLERQVPKNEGPCRPGPGFGSYPESNKKLLKGFKQIHHVTGFEF